MLECVLCNEHITNPLCPECVGEQIKSWLFEVEPRLVPELNVEILKLNQHLFDKNFCISCKKDMDVCSYCFTEHIFEWLESQVSKELMIEFVKFFNYDFERKGYFAKAKTLGLV